MIVNDKQNKYLTDYVMLLTVCCLEARDYCLIESFHAQCRHWSDVILMEHAQFGRMELGRCVTRNFGHIGCSTDVINQLDVACSGRPLCEFSVSDPSLVRTKPCPKDFTSYLEASYRCVPGNFETRFNCVTQSLVSGIGNPQTKLQLDGRCQNLMSCFDEIRFCP